jgi:hypothetical protein
MAATTTVHKRAVAAIVGETWPTRPEDGRPTWRETMTEQTLINHPRLRVRRVTGSEGPAHDPYAYEELHAFDARGNKVVLHQGLGTWFEVNGTKLGREGFASYDSYEKECRTMFETCCGYTIDQIERMHRKLHERCLKCGHKEFHCEYGFPGETLLVCANCGHISSSYFSRSAIE